MTSGTKNTIVIIVVLIALIGGYFYIEGAEPSASVGGLQQTGSGTVSSSVITLLSQVKSLKIDTTLFKDPAFLSLRSFSVEIPRENVGRDNPFAPIPGVSTNSAPRR